MKDFKGTPGPWVAVTNNYYTDIKPEGTNQCLASTQENEILGIDRAKENANAQLIAAAPELLEALRQLRDYVEDTYPTKEYGYAWAEESHPMSLARAAIAKALGKTK